MRNVVVGEFFVHQWDEMSHVAANAALAHVQSFCNRVVAGGSYLVSGDTIQG
jgi:hypothetical protein